MTQTYRFECSCGSNMSATLSTSGSVAYTECYKCKKKYRVYYTWPSGKSEPYGIRLCEN